MEAPLLCGRYVPIHVFLLTISVLGAHAQSVAQSPEALPLLTTLADIRSLLPEEAERGYTVAVEGIVTYYEPEGAGFFLQDNTDGIFVPVAYPNLEAGMRVAIKGRTAMGWFTPDIGRIDSLRVLEQGPLPAPSQRPPYYLSQGLEDSRWVQVEGMVRGIYPTNSSMEGAEKVALKVDLGTHIIELLVNTHRGGINPDTLIGAMLSASGTAGGIFNERKQVVGISVRVPDRSWIRVVTPGPRGLQDIPLRDARSLLQYSSGGAPMGLSRVQGIVTHASEEGIIYVQDSSGPVRILPQRAISVMPGQWLDAFGFPEPGTITPHLADAIIDKTDIDGLYLDCGWCYGGFKAVPASGFALAHLMATDQPHETASRFRLDRFRTGRGLMDEEGTGSQHNLH